MTDMQILGWIIAIVAFAAGYGLGHQRGQIVGIRWCTDNDEQFDRIAAKIRDERRTPAIME